MGTVVRNGLVTGRIVGETDLDSTLLCIFDYLTCQKRRTRILITCTVPPVDLLLGAAGSEAPRTQADRC